MLVLLLFREKKQNSLCQRSIPIQKTPLEFALGPRHRPQLWKCGRHSVIDRCSDVVCFFFCTAGRQNDKDGKTTTSWWSDDTLSQYLLRAQCFVDQYSNYSLVADAAVGPIQVKK